MEVQHGIFPIRDCPAHPFNYPTRSKQSVTPILRRTRRWRRGRPHHASLGSASRDSMDVDARHRISQRPHADARLCRDTRGRDGRVRQELAARVISVITTALCPNPLRLPVKRGPPPRSRNKLAQEFIDTAYKLWKEGGETALREVMLKQPARFCKLIARCRRGLFQLARVRLILAIADFCGARGEAWRDGCDKLARRGGVERLP
jgi:hypothetical protein